MRIAFVFLLAIFATSINAQLIKSPDEFLGYKLGSHYTEHYKVVDYFKTIAASASDKIHLQSYGKTNEGRELIVAIVSSPENMLRIEEIRKNNLRLAGLLNDKPADINSPAIVWLSYNVHGNEASSTEVALKVLYDLVSGKNADAKNWLNNSVIIIDPCLNPDGRDRYVNWYNQMEGKNPVANPIAREHDEPWPSGRSNHYNFDLNRDWAWQTQIETKQRIKIYNEWMPTIHCDYHEQSVDAPYYFAPAAQPYHEVITSWQRSFQTAIGKNHAKYFDKNGWLYFTKEVFDLFYPSYGDTYPIYNGSIGMTYEQAGNSSGGLSIQVNDDTLTLTDRIAHHFTTSLSTIEISAQNFKKINEEFKNFFDDSRVNGSGTYKTYLVNGANKNKIQSLIELFNNNKIEYTYAKQGVSVKGFHYVSGKDDAYVTSQNDIVVSTYQTKGALVKVLFEPQSKLVDSVTYDITAWALPYVYGVDCYALKDKIATQAIQPVRSNVIPGNDEYGYLIEYNSFSDGKLLATLLTKGIKVRYAEQNFSYAGNKYNKGTLIVLKNDNKLHIQELLTLTSSFNANVTGINTGFMDTGLDFGSDKIRLIKTPTVAMVTGEGSSSTASGEVWHLFEQQLNYPIVLINANNLANVNLKGIDVLIIPDGNYKILSDKESVLKTWVRNGGKIIALESAVQQMATGDWGFKLKKDSDLADNKEPGYDDLKRYENRERQNVVNNTPGAIYKITLDDSHPLAFGYPDYYFSLKMNNYVYEFMKDGWNVGVIKQENQVAGFVGSNAKNKTKDGAVIGVQSYGAGTVIYFADNPMFRSFWENGKLMFTNAVFLVAQ